MKSIYEEICIKYNVHSTPSKIKITEQPTPFPLEKYYFVKNLQPTIIKLIERIGNDIQTHIKTIHKLIINEILRRNNNKNDINIFLYELNNTNLPPLIKKILKYSINDKTFVLFILMVSDTSHSLSITLLRTDYLLDIHSKMKQVEINSIALANYTLQQEIYNIHAKKNKTLKNTAGDDIIEMFEHIKILYDKNFYSKHIKVENIINNSIILMIDNNHNNCLDKTALILKSKNININIIKVTIDELIDNCIFITKNNIFCFYCCKIDKIFYDFKDIFKTELNRKYKCKHESIINIDNNDIILLYKSSPVSIIYYRYLYNFSHYTTESLIMRKLLEITTTISIPNIQTQISTLKLLSSIINTDDMIEYITKEEIEQLKPTLVEFKRENRNIKNWLKKSNVEGGGNVKNLNENNNDNNKESNNEDLKDNINYNNKDNNINYNNEDLKDNKDNKDNINYNNKESNNINYNNKESNNINYNNEDLKDNKDNNINNNFNYNINIIETIKKKFKDIIFLMKKIESKTFINNFYNENKREIIPEIGIGGYNIKHNKIEQYKEISYLIRSKYKENIECGITKGYGGFDTLKDNK